jgi:uncharacterized membrane protein
MVHASDQVEKCESAKVYTEICLYWTILAPVAAGLVSGIATIAMEMYVVVWKLRTCHVADGVPDNNAFT